MTGGNAAVIVSEAQGKLGNLAWIRSEGGYQAHIEDGVLRPLVRGGDLRPWHVETTHKIIFCHDDETGMHRAPPKRTLRYLREHTEPDSHGRLGALQHVGMPGGGVRLAWHDLANTLKAVVLPPRAACLGSSRTLIALNTVYYIPLGDHEAHLLAAYFNSLPVRVFVRAVAERAKDAHFRFFACTVGMLPLPAAWRIADARGLQDLSRAAHAKGCMSEADQHALDEAVGKAYGLDSSALRALRSFDAWLRGEAA